MEEYTPETQESSAEDIKRWFQDNLRIVISIAIVVIIAGGIYSYSKRGEVPAATDQATEKTATDTTTDQSATTDKVTTDNTATKPEVSSASTSKETETSFVETAAKGGNMTVLARKAAADYLEKNQDSALTKEHKIYIEDFLRKNVNAKGGVHVGTSVEFSKDLIQKAIAQSKTLSDKQLKNLQKYSARVASL